MSFKKTCHRLIFTCLIVLLSLFSACESDERIPSAKNIYYKADGRTAKSTEFSPIYLDINSDGVVDFNIFFDLIANSGGDHLYGGINPIGPHLIKSGPGIEHHFLNMGFVVADPAMATINAELAENERWTDEHSTFVIRHTASNGAITYEGAWADTTAKLVGMQLVIDGVAHFGWLRLQFDQEKEEITLLDFAYEKTVGESIQAGDF